MIIISKHAFIFTIIEFSYYIWYKIKVMLVMNQSECDLYYNYSIYFNI